MKRYSAANDELHAPMSVMAAAAEPKKRRRRRTVWMAPVAAAVALAIAIGLLLKPGGTTLTMSAYAISEAQYPEMTQYPEGEDPDYDQYEAWWSDWRAQRVASQGYTDGLKDFMISTIQEFTKSGDGENRVYSPLSVYMALAMLAETTGGESRKQLLDLLGADSIEALREQANAIWNGAYCNDGLYTCILASSLWLRDDMEYDADTMEEIAENYYASSYQGEMGSDEFNKALQDWLSYNTGGLLDDEAETMTFSYDTILSLATTVYFNAKWSHEFSAAKTEEGVFHSASGDVTADFMYQRDTQTYYWGENYGAIYRSFENGGGMWLILPDEGVSVDEVIESGEALEMAMTGGEWENGKYLYVNTRLPKFDISSQFDLSQGLQALGITDVFDSSTADFSPMLGDTTGVSLSTGTHAARVTIDEKGCTAAAFTVMQNTGSSEPPDEEVDFTLDRPFVFVITGSDGMPLFVGKVNNLN
jgi:serpin B